MELQIKEYDKEIEFDFATEGLLIKGKATLSIKETYEPSSIFHEDFYKDELLNVTYKDVTAEVEATGEKVNEIPSHILEDHKENLEEYVKDQDSRYI